MADISPCPGMTVYRLRVVIAGISPLIWRRLEVAVSTTVAGLHAIVQTAFGWSGEHLHRFVIGGTEYGISYLGGPGFRNDARQVRLVGLDLREGERFIYEYNFSGPWRVDLRVEQIARAKPGQAYPRCTGGRRAGPPEDWDGPWAFLERTQPRTLFGTLRLASPRWWHCDCRDQPARTLQPLAELLPERTTPELAYLQARFAAFVSYGITADLLGELLPLGRRLHPAVVRRAVHAVADRLDTELGEERPSFIDTCQRDREELPRPDLPIIVGLDGGYVHSSQQQSRTNGWFEVIAGKAIPAAGRPACFGYVQIYDTKPKRRLFEVLRSQGMQANQQVTFLTDGSEDIRDIPCYLNAQAEHLLDWFHLTMRITVMAGMAKSLRPAPPDPEFPYTPSADLANEVAAQLKRLKWFCWHGNVFRALQTIDDILVDLGITEPCPEQARLLKAVREFDSYIRANAGRIPNYGERHRAGEAISTAFTESAVNQVISKRMVKKQQMRWTPRGAHLLLQVRTRVLNDQLAGDFHRWYPGLRRTLDPMALAA